MTEEKLTIPYRIVPRSQFSPEIIELERAAEEVALKAYAPYSKFRVGAAARLANGTIVVGSNQENAAYPSGICAERTALFHSGAIYPDQPVVALLVLAFTGDNRRARRASPCGGCRQVLLETSERFNRPFEVILPGTEDAIIINDNRHLLPFGFDASALTE